jgi:hypothetical protein
MWQCGRFSSMSKTVDVQKIQAPALKMSSDYKYTTSTFAWAPVIDGTLLVESLTSASSRSSLSIPLAHNVFNSHEGENFLPGDLKISAFTHFNVSTEGLDTWLRGFLPNFNQNLHEQVKQLYPARGRTEMYDFNTTHSRAAVIYLDVVLACTAFWVAKGAKQAGWMVDYNIPPAHHASDTAYVSYSSSVFRKTDELTINSGIQSIISKRRRRNCMKLLLERLQALYQKEAQAPTSKRLMTYP